MCRVCEGSSIEDVVGLDAARIAEHGQLMQDVFGETIDLGAARRRVGAVHDIQCERDTFNMWHNPKYAGALRAPALEAVQIVLSDVFLPPGRGSLQPGLSRPDVDVGHMW